MIIPEGFAQVTLEFTGAAVPTGAAVVFGIWDEVDTAMGTITDTVTNLWETHFNPAIAQTCVLTKALVKKGPNDDGPFYEEAYNLAGNSANVTGYAGACYLLKKATSKGGRKHRGRMYIPGVPEATIDPGGMLTSGTASGLTTAGTNFLAGLSGQDIPMVVLHSDPLLIPDVVLTLSCDPMVATQRRRQRR